MGLSVDSVPTLTAWAESLGGITYPLLSDFYPHGQVAKKYGVLRPEGYSERATIVIDKSGHVRHAVVHPIDQQPDNEELFQVLMVLEPNRQPLKHEIPQNLSSNLVAEVVLYCTPWCPTCRRAREFLKAYGIHYVEIDISRNREAAKQVRSWANGNETTPTFNIRGQILVGYNEQKLIEALGLKR